MIWKIVSTKTEKTVGTYSGKNGITNAIELLDALALDAGYRSRSEMARILKALDLAIVVE